MIIIDVPLGERAYPIHLHQGDLSPLGALLARRLAPGRVLVVSSPPVARLYLQPVLASLCAAGWAPQALLVPDGEPGKSLESWQILVQELLGLRVDRQTPVLALGGGAVGDLVGFAAATVLRGLPLVQVPTTLLAMVDSAVGGKTAVNTLEGKNLVGAFHQPVLVFGALGTLSTLPAEERLSGLGEGLKHGLIRDPALFSFCEARAQALSAGDPGALLHLVEQSCRIKARVVIADEREEGERIVLNFGHTVGHALETALGHGRLPHGICVALGMVAEARFMAARGLLPLEDLRRLEALLARLGLPRSAPQVGLSALLDASTIDKKRARGTVRTAFLVGIGKTVPGEATPAEVEQMLRLLPDQEHPLGDPVSED